MIVCAAANPSIDRLFEVEQLRPGDVHRPALFPLPPFAVRLFFGQMGEELMLASARVLPTKLEASGYKFHYPELKPALIDILRK